jgi:hypothetical protein
VRYYLYACWDCEIDIWLVMESRLSKPPRDAVCPGCWQLVEQDYTRKNVMADAFKPYVERNLTGAPIEFQSRRHRDAVLRENHATYDTNLYGRAGNRRTPWERDLTWDKAQAMASGQRAEASYVPELDD